VAREGGALELSVVKMDGAIPGCPRLSFGGDFMTIQEIARVLRERMGEAARRVPTRVLPS
jgi:hypothetical protein